MESTVVARHDEEGLARAIFEASLDAIVVIDESGTYVDVNPAATALFGRPREDILGRSPASFLAPAVDLPSMTERFAARGSAIEELAIVRPDGTVRNVEASAVANVVPGRHLAILRDVTEPCRGQVKRVTSDARYRAMVEHATDVLLLSDAEGNIEYASPAVRALLGTDPSEWVGRPGFHHVHADDRAAVRAAFERCKASREPVTSTVRWQHVDGSHRWVEIIRVNHLDDPLLRAIVLHARDITDRMKLEQTLAASEERYRVLFEASPLPTWMFDAADLRILAANEAALRTYGYTADELIGRAVSDIKAPGDMEPMLAALAAPGLAYSNVTRHRKKDGTWFDVEVAAHSMKLADRDVVLSVSVDITARRQLEAELAQAQKMEAVGRLAGGVAHDFNNMLAVILADCDWMIEQQPTGQSMLDDVKNVRAAAERAAGLTRQLLAFSRRQILRPRVLGLNALVSDLEKMLTRLIGEDVHFAMRLDPALGLVEADPGQIEQVIMNVVVNARDAMPHGGTITIATRNESLSLERAERLGMTSGPYVALAISDDGCGMDAATRARIFEPFFTTKEAGKGTGLGLSTVFGIVKQSGGAVDVISEVGSGTTFVVFLPRVDAASARPNTDARSSIVGARGDETILLVEDDDQLRAVLAKILRARGYRVREAEDGERAVLMAASRDVHIDLVLTDLVMPGSDGRETAAAIRDLLPDARVIFMSGYSEHAALDGDLLDPTDVLLHKPFSAEELARAVRARLDDPPPRRLD